jgi:hypothetical protein
MVDQIMLRVFVVVFLGVLVSACSRTHLVYRNADWLLEYYAGQTININAAQRERWQPVLEGTLRQHRHSELAYVVAYLDMAGGVLSKDRDALVAGCLVDGALLVSRRHARLAVDLALPLLSDLDQSQVEHLTEYMTKRQAKLIKSYLDPNPESRKDARRMRFNGRIENLIGRLTAEQQRIVDESLERIPDIASFWLAYREQQTAGLLGMLRADAEEEALRQYLESWWVEWDGRSTDYMRSWRVAKREFVVFLDKLGASLTPKQRKKLGKRLAALREDLAAFLSPESMPISLSAVVSECEASQV